MSEFQDKYRFCNKHMLGVHDERTGETHDLLYLSRGKDDDDRPLKNWKLVDPTIAEDCRGKDLIVDGTIPNDQIIVSFKVVADNDDELDKRFSEESTTIDVKGAVVTAVQRSFKKEEFSFKKELERRNAQANAALANTPDQDVPF